MPYRLARASPISASTWFGDNHGEVPARPHHSGVQPGGGKPPHLVVYGARLVVDVVDWCDDVGRIVGYHHVAEHEPSARPEAAGDAGKKVRLTCAVEMVYSER